MSTIIQKLTASLADAPDAESGRCEYSYESGTTCRRSPSMYEIKQYTFDGKTGHYCDTHARILTERALVAASPAEFNVELALRTLAQINATPEEWNQSSWRCNSGMCFAGWAAQLAGFEWAPDHDWENGTTSPSENLVMPNGAQLSAGTVAHYALGLHNLDDAPDLFNGGNGLDDLGRMILGIVGKQEAGQ